MIKHVVIAIILLVAIVSCVNTETPSTIQELSLGIQPIEKASYSLDIKGSFVKKEKLQVISEVSSPVATTLELSWAAPSSVTLSQTKHSLNLRAGETKRIIINATPQRRGFFGIEANAISNNQAISLGKTVHFNAISNETLAPNTVRTASEQPGISSTSQYADNLPIASSGLLRQQEVDRLNGTDNAVLDARYIGFKYYETPSGLTQANSSPQEVVQSGTYSMSFLPNTGSGQPEPGELDEPIPGSIAAQNQKPLRTQNLFCGGEHASTIRLAMTAPSYNGTNNYGGYNLTRTKVQVFDNNGHWNGLIASGYTDLNGNFSYIKPNCDTSSWFDSTPPDIFYVVTGETNNGLQTNVSRVFWTKASYATGTYWEDRSASTVISVASGEAIHTRVLFTSNIMIQRARDVNKLVGSPTIADFPVRIHNFYGTFAPVGVIFYGGSDYETGASNLWLGYAGPYVVTHEFGHEVMWATRNRADYLNIFNSSVLPVSSPGYEDDKCIQQGVVGGLVFGAPGFLTLLISCFTTAYTHSGDLMYSDRLAWSEGFANYYNNVVLLYLNTVDKEPQYRIYLSNDLKKHLFCDATCYPSTSFGTDTDQKGIFNETRVGSFLTRYTIEILAGLSIPTDPNSQTSIANWLDSLTEPQVLSILTQYGRVRDNVIHDSNSKMGLEKFWTELYALRPTTTTTEASTAQKTAICKIAFETRIISVNTPLPCNASGTVKP
jgi:hypothetical protein